MKKLTLNALALAGLLAASTVAHAVPVPTLAGPLDNNTSFNAVVNSTGGSSSISFDLLGYSSLDGVNCCTDTFTLSLNGNTLLSGSYNLGGGGTNVTYTNPLNFVLTGLNPDPNFYGFGALSSISITGLFNLLSGVNTLNFAYAGGAQGLGDEGWGVKNLNVSPVPLPPAAFLLATGILGLAGLRRRKAKA